MALDSNDFVRIPPDGAGKALLAGSIRHLTFTDKVPPINIGDTITGAASGTSGDVIEIVNETGTSGYINVIMSAVNQREEFTPGEDLQVGGVTRATLVAEEVYHVSKTINVGANNPRFGQNVDSLGSAFVRFPQGAPRLDGLDAMTVSREYWVGVYPQNYDENPTLISTTTAGLGALTYDADSQSSELSVDDGAGSSVIRQSNLYHFYQPGIPMTAYVAVAAGGPTAGCVRRWGYFDERNGLFFEYDGTNIYAVVRSDTSGSVVETRIPQTQWNGDRLNGSEDPLTNPSGGLLDVSQFWLYYISFLYYGASSVEFGVEVNGTKTVVHEVFNGGADDRPYMGQGNLPMRWEIVNTGVTSGPTMLRQGSSSVMQYTNWAPSSRIFGSEFRPPVSVAAADTAIAVIRPRQTYKGKDNRGLVLPKELRVYSATEPVYLKITRGGDFAVDTWFQDNPEALLEQGTELGGPPTINDPGTTLYSQLIVPGEIGYVELERSFSMLADGHVKRLADITQWENYAIIVRSTTGTATDVTIAFNWSEVL